MGGKASRDKGNRVERQLKDHFESKGYKSLRVPLSGAAQGFKGDVIVWIQEQELPVEVKARHNEFHKIYVMFDSLPSTSGVAQYAADLGYGALVTYDFEKLGFNGSVEIKNTHVPANVPKGFRRTIGKLLGMHKYVKDCAFLAIKIDHKPFLFIRYLW